jgi:DNA polymerase-3 subunit delta
LAEIKQQFKSRISQAELSFEDFDAQISWERIHQALFTFGFLAAKRMVIARNFLSDKKATELVTKILESYDKISTSDKITLVIVDTDEPGKDKQIKELLAKLNQEKFQYEFNKLNPSQLLAWIKTEVSKRGGQIDPVAANKLVQGEVNNLWKISQTLDSLIAYKDGQLIKSDDLSLFMTVKIDDNIFNLIDAIVQGQERKAFQLINDQLNAGVAWFYLLKMLARQFGILAILRHEIDQADFVQSRDLASKLNLHPFVVQKGLAQAREYSLSQIRQIYHELIMIDSRVKNGGDPNILLSLLAIKK